MANANCEKLFIGFGGNANIATLDLEAMPPTFTVAGMGPDMGEPTLGLAVTSSGSNLFGIGGNVEAVDFFELDPTTVTVTSSTEPDNLGWDLSFQPSTNTLFGVVAANSFAAGTLVTINTADGSASEIGATGLTNTAAIAFSDTASGGNLYAMQRSDKTLYTLNPMNGMVSSTVSISGDLPDGLGALGLEWLPVDQKLLFSACCSGAQQGGTLYTLDPGTAVSTLLGTVDNDSGLEIHDFACIPPEPSAAPSNAPSNAPSGAPSTSVAPSNAPSGSPSTSTAPSHAPSGAPSTSVAPSNAPSSPPTNVASNAPSMSPTELDACRGSQYFPECPETQVPIHHDIKWFCTEFCAFEKNVGFWLGFGYTCGPCENRGFFRPRRIDGPNV